MQSENQSRSDKSAPRGADFVGAVSRAMSVLECFTSDDAVAKHGRLTLTETAKLTGLSRATARRFLLTLNELRYIDTDGKQFWVTPKLVNLTRGFIMPSGLGKNSAAILKELTEKLDESASVGILDGGEIVYIERCEVRRILDQRIVNGTRLPAACTSIGRVLLAGLPDKDLHRWLQAHPLKSMTEHSITDPKIFWDEILRVRQQGFAVVDQELEIGIRSIAVPIKSPADRTIAALNSSTIAARTSIETLEREFLPKLVLSSIALSQTIGW